MYNAVERNYLKEEIKLCYLCREYIEIKYVKIDRCYFHKNCLLKLIKKIDKKNEDKISE